MNEFAKIVIPGIAIDTEFDYAVPESLRAQISTGQLVSVSFGQTASRGVVTRLQEKSAFKKVKDISGIISGEPAVDEVHLRLTRWIADYYFCSWGEALESCLISPPGKRAKAVPARERSESVSELPGLLDEESSRILEQLRGVSTGPEKKPALLWGGLTSQRVKIYLELIEQLVNSGRQALIIFPQIDMIESYQEYFSVRYREQVAIIHSGLSDSEKYEISENLKQGRVRVVLGTRLALFYNFPKLGLVVLEEEQDPLYKSDQKPMYHARDVARKLAELSCVPLVMATSAPTVESYYRAQAGEYTLIKWRELFDQNKVQVNLLSVPPRSKYKAPLYFKQDFIDALAASLARKERGIIFVNMRGFGNYVFCRACQQVVKCPDCDVPLTETKDRKKLFCRYCGYSHMHLPECPACHKSDLESYGFGTETAESVLREIFPQARIKRIDADTFTRNRELKDYDILVGTQALNNYDAFPQATFLGVMLIDLMLNLPDFRAAERTLQHLIRLIQRLDTSRSAATVMIQAEDKGHYLLQAVLKQDWDSFYAQELELREDLKYPPFGSLAQVEVRGPDNDKTEKEAQQLAARFKAPGLKVYGPTPSFKVKLRGQYRQNIILKSANHETLIKLLRKIMPNKRTAAVKISTRVDPEEML